MAFAFLRRATDSLLRALAPAARACEDDPDQPLERWIAGWQAIEDHRTVREVHVRSHRLSSQNIDNARKLGYWPGQEHRPDFSQAWRDRSEGDDLERPWKYRWDRLPKHSAGPGFNRADYAAARERGREVCRATLGEEFWGRLEEKGYLDVPSRILAGVSYRLRVGRRIEVLCDGTSQSPWYFDFLCINPAYPLPAYEFFAHLFLYVRDQEEEVIRVAAPQPWDQALGRTF